MSADDQTIESSHGTCANPIVRETVCKTILNRSGLGDYSLNCYTGCAHACVYCYARFMQRFHPHDEPWGAFVDVKVNAVEVLKRQLRRARPGTVFISSACDGWQPVEAQWRLTRRCCELLLERGFELHVLTKSTLVLTVTVIFALLLILVLLGCWALTLLGMPGNWLMVVATAVYAYLVPSHSPTTLGWKTVVALLVLAALGEISELLASAMGVNKRGGSRRGAVMALVGSIVGGILGVFIGVPIPLVGSVVAAVFFAGLGAMAGTILGEISVGQRLGASWRIGQAAFWGRLAGTLGKMVLGAVMIVVVVAAMLL